MAHDLDFSPVLQPFVDRGEVAGAVVCVADKERVLALQSFGFADVSARVPMSIDALFWVASQTKPITATALMMLVDEGRVVVEDAIEKYLPEFRGQMVIAQSDDEHMVLRRPAHPITVGNVLSHTAGLPFLTPLEQPYIDTLTLRDAALLYSLLPLQFEPDTAYQYSNIGINIAGRIIEVVSGQSYESFLQERLFDPLAMTDTTFWPDETQVQRLAKSYKPGADNMGLEETPVEFLSYPLSNRSRRATPGGGLFSTASDCARFCQMITRGGEWNEKRFVSPQSIEAMTTRHTREGLESYGWGWGVGDGSFGHGGAYSTQMVIAPPRGLVTVFLVQHAGFPGNGGQSHDAFQRAVREQVG